MQTIHAQKFTWVDRVGHWALRKLRRWLEERMLKSYASR